MTTTQELRIELLGITTPKGTAIHLYDLDSDRLETLCGRRIGINPRALELGGWGPQVSADLATCPTCRKKGV